MKKIVFFALLLLISSCSKENPSESTKDNPNYPNDNTNQTAERDTLRREVIKDVFLFADSLKDIYSLDDYIIAKVRLKNENNPAGLPIHIGSYPPLIAWFITDKDDQQVNMGPLTIGLSEFNKTLKPGEELSENFRWSQNIYDKNTMSSGLKAFAGDYTLELGFRGVNCPPLIKHFRISEEGDPLSKNVAIDYTAKDALKFDFVLRNRIGREIKLNTSGVPGELLLINNSNQKSDTVFVQKFTLDKSVYSLAPRSDNILFSFNRPEQEFFSQGIKGGFDMVLNLYFKEKTISSTKPVFIY